MAMTKEINVLMLGGKRCGKTTVLSSMYTSINQALNGTDLTIEVMDQQTNVELFRAKQAIIQHMEQFKYPLTSCEVDDNPTSAERSYSFRLKRTVNGKAKGSGIPFRIYDIPGEWLTGEQSVRVRALIQNCQVIIIAIDTPYLFAKRTDQGYGKYHEQYNKSVEITNFFKNELGTDDLRDRMILFVPIKCERYYHLSKIKQLKDYHRNYMEDMTRAVGKGYQELLTYLRSTDELLGHCTIAVTPILSAGGIDFISFREDPETGKIVSYYQAPEYLPESEMGYSPKFCAQPMLYMLAYLMMQVSDEQSRKNGLYQFGSAMSLGMNLDQMKQALATLRMRMKRNNGILPNDGYLFLQNPKGL